MIYVDQKYISLISHKLRNFNRKAGDDYNFSCPICGDSKKKQRIARGWFYKGDSSYSFKCYNCNAPYSFGMVLKFIDEKVYRQWILEKKFSSFTSRNVVQETLEREIVKPIQTNNILDDIICVKEFNKDHPAIKYITKRKIPEDKWDRIYFSARFIKWINSVKPGTYPEGSEKYEHPRLIFPFFDESNIPFAIAGRAFGNEKPKYLTIKFDETKEKIYGLESIDCKKDIYIVEGQIDSLFLPNCIAAAGSAMNLDFVQKNKNKCIIIYDNEPRSKEIMNAMQKTIDSGYRVFIWPDKIRFKDINECVMNGINQTEVLNMITENTHQGLSALLKYKAWRKIK